MDRAEFLEDLDQALAALRRVIVRAFDDDRAVIAAKTSAVAKPVAAKRALPPVRSPAAPAARPVTVREDAEANGVKVCFGMAQVFFKGKSVGLLNTRHCALIATLARAMPHVIPTGELLQRAWPELSEQSRVNVLTAQRDSIEARLATIGLRLYHNKGFGYALQELPA